MKITFKMLIFSIVLLFSFPANAWIQAAVTAAVAVMQALSEKSDGGVSILIAMSKNLASINNGIQDINRHISEINSELKSLPSENFIFIESSNVDAMIRRLYKIQSQKDKDDIVFEKSAYFRDVYKIFDEADRAQDKLLNDKFKYSFVYYIPLIFTIQSSAYNMQTEMLTGIPSDVYKDYRINRSYWKAVLKDYLDYYEQQINPEVIGSFSWALKNAFSVDDYKSLKQKTLTNLSNVIINDIKNQTYRNVNHEMCFSSIIQKIRWVHDCDPPMHDFETPRCIEEDLYKFNIFRSKFSLDTSRDIPTVIKLNEEVIHTETKSEYEYDDYIKEYMSTNCQDFTMENGNSVLSEVKTLLDYYANNIAKFRLLTSINNMNITTAKAIYSQAEIFLDEKELSKYTLLNNLSRGIK